MYPIYIVERVPQTAKKNVTFGKITEALHRVSGGLNDLIRDLFTLRKSLIAEWK